MELKQGWLEVRQRADEDGAIGPPKGAAGRHKINLPKSLVTILREWKAECPPSALAFPNWQGGVESLANIHTRAWKPLQVAAEIVVVEDGAAVANHNFHALRHFRAAMLIADGANPKEVQDELGHANIATTMDVYGFLFRDEVAEQ